MFVELQPALYNFQDVYEEPSQAIHLWIHYRRRPHGTLVPRSRKCGHLAATFVDLQRECESTSEDSRECLMLDRTAP